MTMVLPTKRISADRSLLAIGATVLSLLETPNTVSGVWTDIQRVRAKRENQALLTYDWFVLALDLLFSLGVVDYREGLLRKVVA